MARGIESVRNNTQNDDMIRCCIIHEIMRRLTLTIAKLQESPLRE